MPPFGGDNVPKASAPVAPRVVVAGAGPAGALAALNLLTLPLGYEVHLVEANNPCKVEPSDRDYAMSISGHGQAALKAAGIWDSVSTQSGVEVKAMNVYMGTTEMPLPLQGGAEGLSFDRRTLSAAILDELTALYGATGRLHFHEASVTHVDLVSKTVTIGDPADKGAGEVIPYDLLVGADGVRSLVRREMEGAWDFEVSVESIFSQFKSFHVQWPASLQPGSYNVLVGTGKHKMISGVVLPSLRRVRGGGPGVTTANVFVGTMSHLPCVPLENAATVEDVRSILASALPVLSECFTEASCSSFLRSRWIKGCQVKCSRYHDVAGSVVIIGDAAHATSPKIGQGCNTALQDARYLAESLGRAGGDLAKALPHYTSERLREGHALVEMSEAATPIDAGQMMSSSIGGMMRGKLRALPGLQGLVAPGEMELMGRGVPLSEVRVVYGLKVTGILDTNRTMRERTKRVELGMEPSPPPAVWRLLRRALALLWALAPAALALFGPTWEARAVGAAFAALNGLRACQ